MKLWTTDPAELCRNSGKRLLDRFRVSAAMRPYVLRMRLQGRQFDFGSDPESAVAFSICLSEMLKVLVRECKLSPIAAERVILKTLDAAVDFQLAELRRDALRIGQDRAERVLDRLIESLQDLANAITRLPTTSKGKLNKRVCSAFQPGTFDTEVFIEIIERIAAAVPELAPHVRANEITSILNLRTAADDLLQTLDEVVRRLPIIDLWEAMPNATRIGVEAQLQKAGTPTSIGPWLERLVVLLESNRPTRKRRGLRALERVFLTRVADIVRPFGLTPSLAYLFMRPNSDGDSRGARVPSRFQRFCHAALRAVGDSRKISARQVSNYKKTRNTGSHD